MLFNSFDFLVFFLIVFAVYWRLPHRPGLYFLLAASYFFYGYWRWEYTGLLILSTLIDYVAARMMPRSATPGRRKQWLILSVIANLSVLGIFKYYNFFSGSISSWFGWSAIPLDILLPVGISFYTFQSMSYTIDVYRGVLEPRRNLMEFALFVSFFPQLVAGPIVRAVDFLPQLDRKPLWDWARLRAGLHLVLRGLIEKVVIADNLAPTVERVYSNPAAYSGVDLWIGTYCFAFQILADFAGYTDIARGVARLLGYEFLENFRRPYAALNITDFWRRWHISLSTWLRDYLYIPLGGSKKGKWKTYRNLLLTMILGGLWHGANWTFVLWGLFHGVLLALNRWFRGFGSGTKEEGRRSIFSNVILMLLTFHVVCIGWVLFRAPNIEVATQILQSMFQFSAPNFAVMTLGAYAVFCGVLYLIVLAEEYFPPGFYFERLPAPARALLLLFCLLILVIFVPEKRVAFIYFQF